MRHLILDIYRWCPLQRDFTEQEVSAVIGIAVAVGRNRQPIATIPVAVAMRSAMHVADDRSAVAVADTVTLAVASVASVAVADTVTQAISSVASVAVAWFGLRLSRTLAAGVAVGVVAASGVSVARVTGVAAVVATAVAHAVTVVVAVNWTVTVGGSGLSLRVGRCFRVGGGNSQQQDDNL